MANTQTTVPLFVANQVLTAAQQNASAGTGVPVFATTVTRDAAFGGSNKALAEGQLCYIEASNIVQYYDGAAWATVGPSTAGGLVCVKAETAFSAVASFTADNVFTSAYTNYLIMLFYTTSADITMQMVLRASGSAATTNYNFQRTAISDTVFSGTRATAQSSYMVGYRSNGAFNNSSIITLFSPQIATGTSIQVNHAESDAAYTTPLIGQLNGNHSTATAYDGIGFSVASGTTSGNYAIYGYSKTV